MDSHANTATATFIVIVQDTTPPTITVLSGIVVEGDEIGGTTSSNPQIVSLLSDASASDVTDPNPTLSNDAPSFFPIGKTTVTFTAIDSSGNIATGTSTVKVVDTTLPSIQITSPTEGTVNSNSITVTGTASDLMGILRVEVSIDSGDFLLAVGTDSWSFEANLEAGSHTITARATDNSGNINAVSLLLTVHLDSETSNFDNCGAVPSRSFIWPPNHRFVRVDILDAKTGSQLPVEITAIMQDELVNDDGDGNTLVDAYGIGTPSAMVKAERLGTGDGRVYHIFFRLEGCNGVVTVQVPLNMGNGNLAVDQGALFDSTVLSGNVANKQDQNYSKSDKDTKSDQNDKHKDKKDKKKKKKGDNSSSGNASNENSNNNENSKSKEGGNDGNNGNSNDSNAGNHSNNGGGNDNGNGSKDSGEPVGKEGKGKGKG